MLDCLSHLFEDKHLDLPHPLARDAEFVRERRIFEARRLAEDPIPLGVLANEFGVSGERVRQIEMLAFVKVQKAVQHWGVAIERPKRQHHRPAVSHGASCAA